MFKNIKWLFFDVGSTIIDEHLAYEHRMQEIADLAGIPYDSVYETAMKFYKQNKKGDLETAVMQEDEKADSVVRNLTEICSIL